MKFICQCSDVEKSSENVFTDGESSFFYKDLPEALNRFDAWLSSHRIDYTDCLIVECDNDVQSAIVLLFLLEKEYNFLVLPKDQKSSQNIGSFQTLPTFCRYRIIINSMTDKGKDAFYNPSHWLQVIPVEGYHQPNHTSQGKLYLKTSGSTGRPKIAVISNAALQGNARNTAERLKLTSSDRIAFPVAIFYSFGLTTAFLSGVAAGASIDIQKGSNLLRYLKRERVFMPNVAFMTPIFCETLVKGRRNAYPYRLTVAAGDRFRGNVFTQYEALSGCLVNLYGSTEMGAISAGSPEDSSDIRSQYVGKPMSGVQLRIKELNENDYQGLEGVGEVWCHHPFRFEGYVDEGGQAVSIGNDDQEGWFRIKDLGRLLPEGYIQIFGRSDHSVNRDGRIVFFSDIEKAMASISGIESVVVISKGDGRRGKGLIAFCVPVKGAHSTPGMIQNACFNVLPKNAIPDHIALIDALPLLQSGKIDRQQLYDSFDFSIR